MRRGPTKLFVGNLAYQTDKDALTELFSRVGVVSDVSLPRDLGRPRRNQGYGFVQMATASEARLAKERLEGAELDSRRVHIEWGRS